MRIPLATVKQHLRVEHSADDALIAIYTEAIEEHVEHWCERAFGATFPASVQAAILLGVGDLYENRESVNVGNIVNAMPTMDRLLHPHRSYANAWGFTIPPIVAAFDPTPIICGADWARAWKWKNPDGSPVDVTGYTGTFALMSGDTVIHDGALIVHDATGGEFRYTIDDAVTATFEVGERWYRVRVVSSGGEATVIDRRRIQVQR